MNTNTTCPELAQLDRAIARLEHALLQPVDARLYAAFQGGANG